jgi:hypothetical protein
MVLLDDLDPNEKFPIKFNTLQPQLSIFRGGGLSVATLYKVIFMLKDLLNWK